LAKYGVGARFVSETAHLKIHIFRHYGHDGASERPCRDGRRALGCLVATHNFFRILNFFVVEYYTGQNQRFWCKRWVGGLLIKRWKNPLIPGATKCGLINKPPTEYRPARFQGFILQRCISFTFVCFVNTIRFRRHLCLTACLRVLLQCPLAIPVLVGKHSASLIAAPCPFNFMTG
jgi:hypothetical protein